MEKVVYFNFSGRAEALRLVFVVSGTPFEDIRLTPEEFGAKKASGELPYGQIPLSTVNGELCGQSNALLRYHGKKTGLYPKCPVLAYKVDEIMDTVGDVFANVRPVLMAPKDEQEKLG